MRHPSTFTGYCGAMNVFLPYTHSGQPMDDLEFYPPIEVWYPLPTPEKWKAEFASAEPRNRKSRMELNATAGAFTN